MNVLYLEDFFSFRKLDTLSIMKDHPRTLITLQPDYHVYVDDCQRIIFPSMPAIRVGIIEILIMNALIRVGESLSRFLVSFSSSFL